MTVAVTCCMKPYDIKCTTMPTYVIMAQVKVCVSAWTITDGKIYLARPILAMPHQLFVHGFTLALVEEDAQGWGGALGINLYQILLP